ncbi:MAG: class I adenylate-forming enzyme family protein [Pseudomonadota bacterium]
MSDLSRLIRNDVPPDRSAIVFDSAVAPSTLTYAELQHQIDAVAGGLLERKLPSGATIAVMAANRPEHIIAYFGILRAGHVAVPINDRLGRDALQHIFAKSNARLVFADEHSAAKVPAHLPTIGFDDRGARGWLALMTSSRRHADDIDIAPERDAVIMFTSGSTGQPKGVPITHKGYLWAMRQFEGLRDSIDDRSVLIAAPLFHMNAQFHIQATLQAGSTALLMPRFDSARFIELMRKHEVARVTGVPTMLALAVAELERRNAAPIESVQSVALGSAPFSAQLLAQLQYWFPNALVTNGYGTTETGPGVFGTHPRGRPTPPLSVGYPLPDVEVRLLGPEAPERGVLWVRCPMLARAYIGAPEQTAASFVDGGYITNDVMTRDEHGFFFFAGRSDDMFVCAGENIYPGDVEQLLLKHPAVREAAVVPVDDEIKNALPVAFVVADSPVDETTLRDFALAEGPAYAHPRAVYFLDQLPLADTKKVDRSMLEAEARQRFQR